MTINIDSQKAFDPSIIISIFALIASLTALYYQFFRKSKKLILNLLFSEFSSHNRRDVAQNKISLSNSGNTTILLVSINYQTVSLTNTTSTYETNLNPNNLPILLKPGDTVLYNVISNADLFLNAIKDLELSAYGSFSFNVYLKLNLVLDGKSSNHQVLLHDTQYYNPQKVHHHYAGVLNGVNILEKKYIQLL